MMQPRFRAWIKSHGIMARVYRIYWDGVWNREVCCVVDKEGEVPEYYEALDESEVELMQFTGLRDKNGKEIYQGDVVECVDHVRGSVRAGEKGKVVFGGGQFVAESLPPDNWDPMALHFGLGITDVVVIGNIYENPELLKS